MNLVCLILGFVFPNCPQYRKQAPSKGEAGIVRDAVLGEVPHQAVLEYFDDLSSAVIVSPDWLLTVGHFFVLKDASRIVIRYGTITARANGTTTRIRKVVFNRDYDYMSHENDLALVQLRNPIEFNENVHSIPIAQPNDDPAVGDELMISGFGSEGPKSGKLPLTLKVSQIDVISLDDCNKAYTGFNPITENRFCTSRVPNIPSFGDSGSPVTYQGKLVGITTFNATRAKEDHPIMHMKIAKYYKWINKRTKVVDMVPDNLEEGKQAPSKGEVGIVRDAVLGEVPHQVDLEYFDDLSSAVIVSPNWLITVGHFFVHKNANGIVVRYGTITARAGGTTTGIRKVVLNRDYDYMSHENDLALVQITNPIEFNENVHSIPIAQPNDDPAVGDEFMISGFGSEGLKSGKLPLTLKVSQIDVISLNDCNKAYTGFNTITENRFCTSRAPNISSVGDSGSPVTCQGKLVGITTFNATRAQKDHPTMHMKIAKYYKWINERTNIVSS